EAALRDAGLELVRARDAGEAVRLLGDGDFAAVLLDSRDRSALATARRLRGAEHPRRTPLLFLTPAGADFPAAEAVALGRAGCLAWPCAPEALGARVGLLAEL